MPVMIRFPVAVGKFMWGCLEMEYSTESLQKSVLDGLVDTRMARMNGQGAFTFSDGATYVGEVCPGGTFHGQGFYTFADGSKYVGAYKDDDPNGQGTLNLADRRKFTGEFRDFIEGNENDE